MEESGRTRNGNGSRGGICYAAQYWHGDQHYDEDGEGIAVDEMPTNVVLADVVTAAS